MIVFNLYILIQHRGNPGVCFLILWLDKQKHVCVFDQVLERVGVSVCLNYYTCGDFSLRPSE